MVTKMWFKKEKLPELTEDEKLMESIHNKISDYNSADNSSISLFNIDEFGVKPIKDPVFDKWRGFDK